MKKNSILYKKSYLWITLIFFIVSLGIHWISGWSVYKTEQQELGLPVQANDYLVEMLRDTMENWQSEFLQLVWQVAGLAFLLYVGSPQSKESEERIEEKVDYILSKLEPERYKELQEEWDKKYPRE